MMRAALQRSHDLAFAAREIVSHMTVRQRSNTLRLGARGYAVRMQELPNVLSAYASQELAWRTGVVLVVDVVESVRLMRLYQGRFIACWISLRARIEADVIGPNGGRVVKSTGDGMLVEFGDVRAAARAALAVAALSREAERDDREGPVLALRVGLDLGELLVDSRDVYGEAANLAARLCSLAEPGEVVVSAAIQSRLVDALDADIEDIGDCYVKHLDQPIRAYRLALPGSRRGPHLPVEGHDLIPTVAIVPFADRHPSKTSLVLGDVLADELIHALSRSQYMNVISRLSTSVFRWRRLDPADIGSHLGAKYVIAGSYAVVARDLHINVELAETRSGQVLLRDRLVFRTAELLRGGAQDLDGLISAATNAMLSRELRRVRRQPLPTLESYSMLLGAVALMHRSDAVSFDHARTLLEALVERLPRESMPRAWLAVWYTIKVQQGLSDAPRADGLRANELALRALGSDPESSLALSVCGLIHTNFLKRFDEAERFLDLAIAANPNDSLAILHKSALYQFTDRGRSGYALNLHARGLSPRDPHRYYYEAIAASCAFSAGDYELALQHARESLRSNRSYASSSRVRAASLWQLGRAQEARAAVEDLLALEPTLTVGRWLERSPAADFQVGRVLSQALRNAGVPA